MKLVKGIFITLAVLFLFGLGTMHMWTHPAFILLLVGCISLTYRKVFNNKPITRRYVS